MTRLRWHFNEEIPNQEHSINSKMSKTAMHPAFTNGLQNYIPYKEGKSEYDKHNWDCYTTLKRQRRPDKTRTHTNKQKLNNNSPKYKKSGSILITNEIVNCPEYVCTILSVTFKTCRQLHHI